MLPKKPADIAVSFVTTAAREGEGEPKWLDIYRQQLKGCGITDIEDLDIRGHAYDGLETILLEKDIVFVNGGNTFYLLKCSRESGFNKLVPTLVARGLIYVGVSAGSYIACPTIEQSTWKHQDRNRVGLTELSALNLVPFLISAHYEEKYHELIAGAAKNTHFPIVALTDQQAILAEDHAYRLVGEGERLFFNGADRLLP